MDGNPTERHSRSLDGTPDRHQAQTPPTTANDHLTYPSASTSEEAPPPPPATAQPKVLLKDRLYVGNLHPTVDEYTLLQVFQKYGKISKMDFLFHKAGPMKGKPRGYAFVEYSDPIDAKRALSSANEKLLRGRKLVVTYAHQAPTDDSFGAGGRVRRAYNDPAKPTTLSLLKSSGMGRSNATEDKIAKMEAKLRQMEQSEAGFTSRPSSLPPKPPPLTSHDAHFPSSSSSSQSHSYKGKGKGRAGPPLPSLPLQPPPSSLREGVPVGSASSSGAGTARGGTVSKRGTGLAGVKIVKHRDKAV